MTGLLLKKQLQEVFRGYFYNARKNKKRSKAAVIAWFIFFAFLMVGILGGAFTVLSLALCAGLVSVGMGWLYFALMSGIAIVLGAFGSVFNTYSGLYLAKDNDLLLSMPIPVRSILAARLLNVYLLGAMYSCVVSLPAVFVYWAAGPAAGAVIGAAQIICGLVWVVLISLIVLVLSVLLGWVVAKISRRLKHKSFITVLLSLLFFGAYYFVYFKASDFISNLLQNAEVYGEKIKGAAHLLWSFGTIGTGSLPAALGFTAALALVSLLLWRLLSRSFLSLATAGGTAGRKQYREKTARERTAFGALLAREFAGFTASAGYMLNCGLGVLLLPAGGVLLLVKGGAALSAMDELFSARPGAGAALLTTVLCLLCSMNDMAAPSVSLEGRRIWIPQSLPVEPGLVLRAKACMQLLLTALPALFAGLCAAIILPGTAAERVMTVLVPLAFAAFSAVFCTCLSICFPSLTWTSEMAPLKQSACVFLGLFGGWLLAIAFGGLYLLLGFRLGFTLYAILAAILLAAAAGILLRWLDTRGAERFARL